MSGIDVVVPCYQYGRYLRDCIRSITSQDVPNLRVLIIENGSTDESLELAQELARDDRRITIAHHPRNLGQKHAYNQALDWASAPYFMILDADDVLATGALARAVSVMDGNPSVAFCHGTELRLPFPAGSPPPMAAPDALPRWTIETGPQFIKRICQHPMNPVGTSTVVFRTATHMQVGYYNEKLPHTDDLEMWLRLACHGDVAETDAVQAARRIHEDQLTRLFEEVYVLDVDERIDAFDAFFAGAGRDLANSASLHRCAVRSVASKAYWSALSHVVRGHRKPGFALMKFAVRHCPSLAIVPPLDWLSRVEKPWQRVAEVLAAAAQSRVGALREVRPR
jgi:glycosyltransferase involved in cell wall biosynthesis